MATIKEKPLLNNNDKPALADKLAEIGNACREIGMGIPMPVNRGSGNEGFEIFQTDKVTYKKIVKQHICNVAEAFTILSHGDIHNVGTLRTKITVDDINFKNLTAVNVSRFLTQVTNLLEQVTHMDHKTPNYMGAKVNLVTVDRLSDAWKEATKNIDLTGQYKLKDFASTSIEKLCKLVAEAHLIAGIAPINAVIAHNVAQLPEPVKTTPVVEEEQPVDHAALSGPFHPTVEELPTPRQQTAQIPEFGPGTPEHLAFKTN